MASVRKRGGRAFGPAPFLWVAGSVCGGTRLGVSAFWFVASVHKRGGRAEGPAPFCLGCWLRMWRLLAQRSLVVVSAGSACGALVVASVRKRGGRAFGPAPFLWVAGSVCGGLCLNVTARVSYITALLWSNEVHVKSQSALSWRRDRASLVVSLLSLSSCGDFQEVCCARQRSEINIAQVPGSRAKQKGDRLSGWEYEDGKTVVVVGWSILAKRRLPGDAGAPVHANATVQKPLHIDMLLFTAKAPLHIAVLCLTVPSQPHAFGGGWLCCAQSWLLL